MDVGRRPRALPAPGDLKLSLIAADHDGWILLDGRVLARTAYPRLYAALGTRYGAGDGRTTFGIPDARDGFLCAAGAKRALGATGGADSLVLGLDQIPAHSHGYARPSAKPATLKVTLGLAALSTVGDLASADATTAEAGAAAPKPIPTVPPFLAVNAFVYAGM